MKDTPATGGSRMMDSFYRANSNRKSPKIEEGCSQHTILGYNINSIFFYLQNFQFSECLLMS